MQAVPTTARGGHGGDPAACSNRSPGAFLARLPLPRDAAAMPLVIHRAHAAAFLPGLQAVPWLSLTSVKPF